MKIEITKSEWWNILSNEYQKQEWLLNLKLMISESSYNETCFEIQKELKTKYIIK